MFICSKLNPILKPEADNWWESRKLYNPGAIFHDGKYHLFYRAVGSGEDWKSSIGYAVSGDGENFERFVEPLLIGDRDNESERRGLEDPRITKIGDLFYMAYAAYDGVTPRLSIAVSRDFKSWRKQGSVFSDWMFDKAGGKQVEFVDGKPVIKPKLTEWSKSGALFPEKVNGKFLMLFGEFNIWFAESDDGINWVGGQAPFLGARTGGYFDNAYIEMGPPPIKTEKGWLVLYHGIDSKLSYKIGFLLLDFGNPKKILFRSEKPIFESVEDYEMSDMVDILPGGYFKMQKMNNEELKKHLKEAELKGIMPRVTFCCGAVLVKNMLRIYYGASDSVICTATADINDILGQVK